MGPSGSEENFPTFPHFNTLSDMLSASSSDYIGEEMQILLLVQPHLRNNKQFRQMMEYMHSVWSWSLGGWGNRSECVPTQLNIFWLFEPPCSRKRTLARCRAVTAKTGHVKETRPGTTGESFRPLNKWDWIHFEPRVMSLFTYYWKHAGV